MFLGLVLETIIKSKLTKLTERTRVKFDDAIVNSIRGMVFLWLLLAGLYGSLLWAFGSATWMEKVDRLLVSILILSFTVVATRITVELVTGYSRRAEAVLPSITIFSNLAKLLVLFLGVLVLLQYLGISITPILTALGVGGIAVALALQDTLSNTFAGIHILLSRQIKPGDYIKLDSGEEGFVTDINWRNTSIRMMSNNMVLIPNQRLSTAIVTNHELPDHALSVLVEVGVSYSSDLQFVEKTVCEVASEVMKEVPGGVSDFTPLVRFHSFSESSIDLTVILRAQTFVDQYLIKHEFIKRLHRRFDEARIEIPFPIRTVHLHSKAGLQREDD